MSSWGEIALKNALNNDQITIIGELPEKTGKRNKFNAVAVVFDGIRFDSKAEMARYGELRLLELGGQISNLAPHPTLDLYAGVKYKPDFMYTENGVTVVEDVKGGKATQTDSFKNKWKQAKAKYPEYRFVIVEAK
jgi:hypothetical protein